MTSSGRATELRTGGLKLWARFTLAMTVALTVVMSIAGLVLYRAATEVAENVQERSMRGTVEILAKPFPRWEEVPGDVPRWGPIARTRIKYGPELGKEGFLYRYNSADGDHVDLIVPGDVELAAQGLLGLIVSTVIIAILVGAAVAVFVANQVSTPLENIVMDIGQIASGNLKHRTRVRGGGEIALLARSVDRMAKNLQEAQENELELSIRDREREVAAEVREALLPQTTPAVDGYEVGAKHVGSQQLGGDFHDFVTLPDGRVGLLVCDVSGTGLPGALVGATAGAYLRRELAMGGDVGDALKEVNRRLVRDVRRGMYASVLYALVDPRAGVATVACAGHKLPLIRYTASDQKIRLVHPEGISLAFDKGPIFDSRLEVQQTPIEPGDRLVLANTGPVVVVNSEGNELGEKAFYSQVLRNAARPSDEFLARLVAVLEKYAAGEPFPRDVSIVTIARK